MSLKDDILKRRKKVFNDLGFGTGISEPGERFVRQDGSFNITRTGYKGWHAYKVLVNMSWPKFFLLIFGYYIFVNAFFGLLLALNGIENVSGAEPGSFIENFANCFFLSVQTYTSVGYGALSPSGWTANVIVTIIAFVGLMSFSLFTGLFFARFSKPVSHVIFSDQALIMKDKNGIPCFQFRIVNPYKDQLLDVRARVIITYLTDESMGRRRIFSELELERDHIEMFPLNWNIVHPIGAGSPLFGKSRKELNEMHPEFLVLIKAYDEVFSQEVHRSTSYVTEDILWNRRFVSMYSTNKQNGTVLDISKLSQTIETEKGNKIEEVNSSERKQQSGDP